MTFTRTIALSTAAAVTLCYAGMTQAGECGSKHYHATSAHASHAEAEKPKDIVDTAVAAGSFKTLAAALEAGDLIGALKGKGPFTVFAPTDEAFGKLPEGTVEALLKDKDKLRAILTYHVVPGKVMAADVVKLKKAKTLQGAEVKIDATKGVKINESQVVKADIPAANGVIHVIDSVLIPN